MANITVTLQDVNGDPETSGGNINITTSVTTGAVFNEPSGTVSLSTVATNDTVTIGGFTYTYAYLGSGDVRGDAADPAAFIRILSGDPGAPLATGTTFAIDLSGQPGDPDYPNLPNGNTKLKVNTLDTSTETGFPCFASGTMIETPGGPRAVEDLCAGDLVETQDDGAQPLVWVGAREVRGQGRFAPVRFAPGAIGNARTLWLSPQHRVLVRGWRAELLYGAEEVLVAACHLINDTSIRRDPRARICYHHILFDRHQVVRAEGAPVESLYPGDGALDALTGAARDEVLALFPELAGGVPAGWLMARRALTGAEGRVLATGG